MTQKLEGKVAVFTGASSGIGEAMSGDKPLRVYALALAAEGAKVALAARRIERLEELVKRISKDGGQAMSIAADVSDEAQVREMVSKTQSQLGRVDILVNCAGVMLTGGIGGANTEDWRRMINLNLLGLMYATHAALECMHAQGSGDIVNISSIAGRISGANFGVYCASKFGVTAFTEALRQEELKNNIRVIVVEPGTVKTELSSHITNEASREEIEKWKDSMTLLDPADIAQAVVYAVSQPRHVSVSEMIVRPTEQQL